MHWFHRYCAGAHTWKPDTNSNANANDYSDRNAQPDARDIHQHNESYAHEYIHAYANANRDSHIHGLSTCHIDGLFNVDAIVNSFADSFADSQLYIDAIFHCRRSFSYAHNYILPISNSNKSLT